jgi:hypothetical protein
MLAPFRLVDSLNVYGAIAPAMVCWEEAIKTLGKVPAETAKELFLEKLGLRRLSWGDRLMRPFRKSPALAKDFKATWKGTESFGNHLWDWVKMGKAKQAQLEYLKWGAWTGQWAYGTPEAPPIYRGSVMRLFTQYKSWWTNYATMLTGMSTSRMGGEWLRLVGSWGAVGMLGHLIGAPLWKWIAAGPFPQRPFEAPPALQAVMLPYTVTRGLAERTQHWLFPSGDDIELLPAHERIAAQLESLDRRYVQPFAHQYELLTGERTFPEWARGEKRE